MSYSQCIKCKKEFPAFDKELRFDKLIRDYLCKECYSLLVYDLQALKRRFLEESHPLNNGGIFPPPWNFYEHPEKTEGWVEFQKEMKKHPKYYLEGINVEL